MRTARHAGWRLLLLAVSPLATACASTSFFIPGDTPAKPAGKPARAMVLACDEAPRHIVVSEAASLRLLGPLDVVVMDPSSGEPRAKGDTPAYFPEVPANAELKVKVHGMEKSGNAWGALCFCRGFLGMACTPDCEEADSRIDVRVSCPATRFAKRDEAGRISPPLPAHLPVPLTCTRSQEASKPLQCEPTLVALEEAGLSVFGALKLAEEAETKDRTGLVFSEAESGGSQQSPAPAFLCLRNACSNPAYYLPLEVTFEGPPPLAPAVSTRPAGPPVHAYCGKRRAMHPAE